MSSFRDQSKASLWSIERVVALLTPLFAAAAGWLTSIIAKAIPGVNLDPTQITALFGVGATVALGAALKWLHGRSQYVNLITEISHGLKGIEAGPLSAVLSSAPIHDIEDLLRKHEAAIIDALGGKLGASASAEDIAKQIVQQLWPERAAHAAVPLAGPAAGASS